MIPIRWVGQEDPWGCGVACAAMLTGKSYTEVRAWYGSYFAHRNGLYWQCVDEFLVDHGHAVARRYKCKLGRERAPWPPAPFAPAHLCEVVCSETSPGGHFVVMLADGTVLDPLTPEPRRLVDYWRVHNVAAVVRARELLAIGSRVRCVSPGSWVDQRAGVVEALDVESTAGIRGHRVRIDGANGYTVLAAAELIQLSDEAEAVAS